MVVRKASGLLHPGCTSVVNEEGIAFLGAHKCSVGIIPGAGTSLQAHGTSPSWFVLSQSRLSAPKPFSAQWAICWKWRNVGINPVWQRVCTVLLFDHPCTSLLDSSFVWGCRRDGANLICHLYCSAQSTGSYLQLTIQTVGWRWESSFPSRPFFMDLIAIAWVFRTNINSLSQHPCEMDFDVSYFTAERGV